MNKTVTPKDRFVPWHNVLPADWETVPLKTVVDIIESCVIS